MTQKKASLRAMPQRKLFIQPSDSTSSKLHHRSILQLLLAQDGSATRLCECAAGGPIVVDVQQQRVVSKVPNAVEKALPGESFIERFSSLSASGEVLMDNLVYIALKGLPAVIQQELEALNRPIGHTLARMWVRRECLQPDSAILERLWDAFGMPDVEATRMHRLVTPDGPRMLLAECFRRGMLMS
ncbi:MAG: hypothetical protein V4505_04200 [Pseudomonadota bacterium]